MEGITNKLSERFWNQLSIGAMMHQEDVRTLIEIVKLESKIEIFAPDTRLSGTYKKLNTIAQREGIK